MKLLLELTQQDLKLSQFEVEELLNLKKTEKYSQFLIISTNKLELINRLSYTNAAYQILFTTTAKNLKKKIKSFQWNKYYKKNYSVRNINLKIAQEKDYASLIWYKLKNPKVNLNNAETKFFFIKLKGKVFATKQIWTNSKDFIKRKAHLRPELHPSSLDPRLAKACVNIAVKDHKNATLMDPFCGSGGILIEAGLMKLKIVGHDIDDIMLRRAAINLNFYKIHNFRLEKKDALKIYDEKNITGIVTDLPYGKNTKSVEISRLINNFLLVAYKITKTVVIMFPSDVDYKKLLGEWKIKNKFEQYLHKSLTKKILVLTH